MSSSSIFLLFLFFATTSVATAMDYPEEKMIHLRFYTVNLTLATVARLPDHNDTLSSFGDATVLDSPLTEVPSPSSKPFGVVQGFVVGTSLTDHGLTTAWNFVFTDGKYTGSSLAVYGIADSPVQGSADRTVVGGSGQFRLSRGYVLSKFYSTSPDIVVQFDFYVVPFS